MISVVYMNHNINLVVQSFLKLCKLQVKWFIFYVITQIFVI
jgi:hypothetical protein